MLSLLSYRNKFIYNKSTPCTLIDRFVTDFFVMRNAHLKFAAVAVLLAFVINLLVVETAQAQFSMGLKVAGNSVNYKKLTEHDFGIEAGVFLRLGNKFFFQPEVNYSLKRSTFLAQYVGFSSNENLRQHFLSVPALLGYHFIDNDNFKFRLTLGPRFDFKISDNIEESDWSANSLQWGGQVGLGVDLWRFTLDANYCIAAANFRNMMEGSMQTKQMNMFIVSLGFKIVK